MKVFRLVLGAALGIASLFFAITGIPYWHVLYIPLGMGAVFCLFPVIDRIIPE
jgi:hypothetical protein